MLFRISYSGKYFSNKHSAFLSKKHLSVDVTYLEDIILRTVAWNSFWNMKINLVYILTANLKSSGFFPEFTCFLRSHFNCVNSLIYLTKWNPYNSSLGSYTNESLYFFHECFCEIEHYFMFSHICLYMSWKTYIHIYFYSLVCVGRHL